MILQNARRGVPNAHPSRRPAYQGECRGGVEYTLDRNEGTNLLHGGNTGFHQALWNAEQDDGGLVMRLEFEKGDAGFSGNVDVTVRYTFDDEGELTIEYEARTDAPTPINLTHHAYFNLTAEPGADIRGHVMSIEADRFFEVEMRSTWPSTII